MEDTLRRLGRRTRAIRDSMCVHRPTFYSLSFPGIEELMLSRPRNALPVLCYPYDALTGSIGP
jgi:hypothetical protein